MAPVAYEPHDASDSEYPASDVAVVDSEEDMSHQALSSQESSSSENGGQYTAAAGADYVLTGLEWQRDNLPDNIPERLELENAVERTNGGGNEAEADGTNNLNRSDNSKEDNDNTINGNVQTVHGNVQTVNGNVQIVNGNVQTVNETTTPRQRNENRSRRA
ncbi:hypothetical protein AJ80_05220 [Polytolypa hystricis UAMH7299]|uniref:Uncharacterized protein n=1 Tax=Polytolypa hystricis (strain UAMH7299) TaxID=1447883 RepID=A0A2B7Y560_POLH7|nr:hypothetical protein AJ80_05220 [Polytolypa hystricis UAMH7299]